MTKYSDFKNTLNIEGTKVMTDSLSSPSLAASPDLLLIQPRLSGRPAAPEEVVVAVPLVAGPGEPPA